MNLASKNFVLFFLLILFTANTFPAQVSEAEEILTSNGNNFARNGEYDKAIAEYSKAIAINSRNAKAFYFRAVAKFAKQDKDGAITDFTKIIELLPKAKDIDKIYNFRGILFYDKNSKKQALADFDKAILINPSNPDPYNGRGNIFTDWDKLNAALFNYSKSIELNPNTPTSYIGRANIFFIKGLLDKSLSDYNKAIELNPSSAAFINRGKVYGLKNKWVDSINDLTKGFEMHSQSNPPFLGNITVSLSDFDKYIIKNPKSSRAFAVRGFMNLLQKKEAEANRDFKRSFEIEPKLKIEIEKLIKNIKENQQ